MKRLLTIVVVLAAACGGKSKSEPARADMPEHAGQGDDHANMPPEIAKFHDVLAPRWHADKGPQRMKDTCAAIPDFQSSADALAKAALPPGADAAEWSSGGKELGDAVVALKTTCDKSDAVAFEPAFERVHKGFHAMMEAAGGGHGEHDDGEEHGMHGEHHEHGH